MGILDKNGGLDEKELQAIKKHPVDGFRMLQKYEGTEFSDLYEAGRILLMHHAWKKKDPYPKINDYPLTGNIREFSQILAASDIFDALSSQRSYKPALSLSVVEEILIKDFSGNIRFVRQVLERHPEYNMRIKERKLPNVFEFVDACA